MGQPVVIVASRQAASGRIAASGRLAASGRQVEARVPNANPKVLQDTFSSALAAGAVNGSLSDSGASRLVADTNLVLSITGGALSFATGGLAQGDPGLWYPSQSRVAGKVLFGTVTIAASGAPDISFGLDNEQSGAIANQIRFSSSVIRAVVNGVSISLGLPYATAVAYKLALVMRTGGMYLLIKGGAYTTWTLLWVFTGGSAAVFPAAIMNSGTTTIFTLDDVLIPFLNAYLLSPSISDSFVRANGALGSSDGLAVAEQNGGDGLAWTGATWTIAANAAVNTPTLGSEQLVDGALENWTNATTPTSWTKSIAGSSTVNREDTLVHGGSHAARLDIDSSNSAATILSTAIVNAINDWIFTSFWARNSGSGTGRVDTGGASGVTQAFTNAYAQYFQATRAAAANVTIRPTRVAATSASLYYDDLSTKVLTLASLFSAIQANQPSDVDASVAITLVRGTQAGIVLNLDSITSPANYVIAYHDGINAKLDKVVAGTPTSMISASATYVAGATLRVKKIGTTYGLWYNDALVGAVQTISDAGIINNRKHGLFSTYSGNSLVPFIVFPSGTANEYNQLDILST